MRGKGKNVLYRNDDHFRRLNTITIAEEKENENNKRKIYPASLSRLVTRAPLIWGLPLSCLETI